MQRRPRIFAETENGNEIFQTKDEMGSISVVRRGDRNVLVFDSGLEQSSIYINKSYYLDYEYNQAMLLSLIFTDVKDVTLLGLGGGSVAHCLFHYFRDMTINVVELRQAVIDVAYEYFLLPRDARLKVYQRDAEDYICDATIGRTDVIFSDLYEAHSMADIQSRQDFFENCYNLLNDSGCLVLNFHYMPEADYALMHIVRTMFAEIRVCNAYNKHWILFCLKAPLFFEKETLKARAALVTEQVKMPLLYYYRELKKV